MKKLIYTCVAIAALSTAAQGGSHAQNFGKHLKARQGQMQIIAMNLGILGGMAKGEMEYDVATAQAAAKSLHGVSMIHIETLYPDGSGGGEGTRAKASIWEDSADFAAKWAAFGDAARNAAKTAGDGAEALKPLLGQLGGACKACHEKHRAPQN